MFSYWPPNPGSHPTMRHSSSSAPTEGVTESVGWHILPHLSHLKHGRQGEVHIKDGCFHVALLTCIRQAAAGKRTRSGPGGHILHHLSYLNHGRQYKVHIKDESFHIGLLTIGGFGLRR